MPDYSIKTKAGEKLVIFIPKEINPTVRKIIKDALKTSSNKEYAEQMVHEFENLSSAVQVLIDHLKKDKVYSKKSELLIRKMIGIYLKRGLEMSKYIREKPAKILEVTRMIHPDIRGDLLGMGKKQRWVTEYILHSFLLGKQCYETGLSLGAILSLDKINQYKKDLEKEVDRYIR